MNVNGRRPAVACPPGRAAAHPPAPGPLRAGDHPAAGDHHRRDRLVDGLGPLDPGARADRPGAGRRDRPAAGRGARPRLLRRGSGARSSRRARSCPTDPKAGEAIRGTDVRLVVSKGPERFRGRPGAGGQGLGRRSSRSSRRPCRRSSSRRPRQYDNYVAGGRGGRLRPARGHRPDARPGRHGRRQQGPRAGRRPRRDRAEPRAGQSNLEALGFVVKKGEDGRSAAVDVGEVMAVVARGRATARSRSAAP